MTGLGKRKIIADRQVKGRMETVISLKILQLWMAGIEFGFFEANE